MREHLTLKELSSFSEKKIQRLQNIKFRAVCRYILPMVPFYSNLFSAHNISPKSLKSVEDWHSKGLPLIKKSAYLKNPKDFIASPNEDSLPIHHAKYLFSQSEFSSIASLIANPKEILTDYYSPKMLVFSGGTESNNPAPMFLTAKQKFSNLFGIVKIIGDIIMKNEEKTVGMNLFPYAPHLGWHAVHHALDSSTTLNLCTAAGNSMPTERLVLLADKLKPDVICGMSDYLRNRFLPMAIQKKVTLPKKVIFVNGAQKMLDAERIKIVELAKKIGVEKPIVLDMYGASELKEAILPECSENSGFHHIAPLSAILKTVSAKPNEGDLIDDWEFTDSGLASIWNIGGAASVLAGYVIGDSFERIEKGKCPNCSLNVDRIFNINRLKEISAQLKFTGTIEAKLKGTKINLVEFRNSALLVPEVSEAQVALTKRALEIRFVSDSSQAIKKLKSVFANSELKPKLIKTTLSKLQGYKIKFEGVKIES